MSTLAAQLNGVTDDDAIVKILQRKILENGNEEATAYLRGLSPERADALRWKLVASLESISQHKKQQKRKKKVATPQKPGAAAGAGAKPSPPTATQAQQQPPAAPLKQRQPPQPPPAAAVPSMTTSSELEDGSVLELGDSDAAAGFGKPKKKGKVLQERFQMGDLIGKGGFAKVYKALDLTTGEQVAIKEIDKDLVSNAELPKILAEGEILGRLSHPNIVKFIRLIQEKKQIYFVMEYISGGSLYHTMKKFGVFPEQLVCVYTAQALLALEYLHAQGVLHRDIKGANLLINSAGKIKLADFGACTYAQLDRRLTVIGTPFWMAPEIIEMTSGGTAADLWSLGCTVIELLTGSPPYYTLGAMQALFKMVDDDHPPLPPGISKNCEQFLMQCFVKDYAKRPGATQLLTCAWIKQGVQGKEIPALSRDEMQMTLRQHNQTKKAGLTAIDWSAPDNGYGSIEEQVLKQQARELKHEEEPLKAKLARKEKERARLARSLAESKATLAALKKDIVALTAEQSKIELSAK